MSTTTLNLHIGCGKTGSSALQVWLSQTQDELQKHGIYYPNFGQQTLSEYDISSGNGLPLLNAVKSGNCEAFLKMLLKESPCKQILLSSEAFQLIDRKELRAFESAARGLRIHVNVIAYVRNIYEITYSLYLQGIKRHGLSRSFDEHVKSLYQLQQFEVVKVWEEIYPNIRVIHYDTNKDRLDLELLSAIGFTDKKLPRMTQKRVNRSLNIYEAELLRQLNKKMSKIFDLNEVPISQIVSDHMIYSRPEIKTKIFKSNTAISLLSDRFQAQINAFNKRHFSNQTGLCILSSDSNQLTEEWVTLRPAALSFIEAIAQLTYSVCKDGKIYARKI